jgi:protease-4
MFLIFVSLVGSSEDTVVIKDGSVLEIQLQRPIADYVGNHELDPFNGLFKASQGLDEILHAINVAKDDDRIQGISLNNNLMLAGMAQTQTLRKALVDFKAGGKFIYAYGDFYLQKDYYLSSVADSLFINPVGALDFKGLSSEVLYLKEIQEKSGIKMEVVRHGKYKSAVEPYLQNEMSASNREQLEELLKSLWGSMVDDIAVSRNIASQDLNIIADTLGGRLPEMAVKTGLIDGLAFMDQYELKLKQAMGNKEEGLHIITLEDYKKYAKKKSLQSDEAKIAVIFAQGEIFYGEGGPDIIGQYIINEALIKAREDDRVKAVVLRVDSPGGSALASDIIWREVVLTKQEKPVIVSMGNVAASGGYYIAAGADRIFAEPMTITGSIGVFGTVPNISQFADDIGINAEQVGTNKNAVDYSLFEPMGDEFRAVLRESIENTYRTFLERVASGRQLSLAEVDSMAQGRVWSGNDAQRLGLVDDLGTLDDAIIAAAEMAGVSEYGIRKYPKYKTGFERLMEDLGGASAKAKEDIMRAEMGEVLYKTWKTMKSGLDQQGVQAKMPFTLNIR